jgi:hypothetical protein
MATKPEEQKTDYPSSGIPETPDNKRLLDTIGKNREKSKRPPSDHPCQTAITGS